MAAQKVKATTADGREIEFDAADLKYSFGQAVDEETFRQRYAGQGLRQPPNVVTLHDLARLKLRHKLHKMQGARLGPKLMPHTPGNPPPPSGRQQRQPQDSQAQGPA